MLRSLLLSLVVAGALSAQPAQSDSSTLKAKLSSLTKDFDGDVGIYVRHLTSGETAALGSNELFPTASMIKVPIMLALFQSIEDGKLGYRDKLTYTKERLYAGEDLLGSFKDGEKITLSKIVTLMIAFSDNTASLWCQELAGTGTAINQWLEQHGFHATRVNSRTPDRKDDWKKYGWGQTTPEEMARLLVLIHEGKAVTPEASDEMSRVLSRSYWNREALSALPPSVAALSKQGAVSQSRSEVVLVNAPSGPYVFCVITKNQKDTGWGETNAGFVLLRQVSATLWNHFEPGSKWAPPSRRRFK